MPIKSGDVKLIKSQVMADVDEGGGAPTGVEIVDGASNAIFPDISELDRAGGRVNLRKTFVSVQTDDSDTYFGTNVIVADPPQDPRVAVTLFSTKDTFDVRTAAQSRIEAYLNKGPLWPGFLYENHIAGQRAIQLFQRPADPLPAVGQTLVLVQDEGKPTQREQYVRAMRVSSVTRTFTENVGGTAVDYQAAIVTLEISDALRTDFTGSPATRYFTPTSAGTRVRDTVVADAGSYVGVVPLADPAPLRAFSVRAQSIYTQLVPSAQSEVAITDAKPYADASIAVRAGDSVSLTTTALWNTTKSLYVGQGITPATLKISVSGTTITDSGGKLMAGTVQVGTVDYANGVLSIVPGGPDYGGSSKTITFVPAAWPIRNLHSAGWDVTAESRSGTIVFILDPLPSPQSMQIHYMAQGRWYVLRDQGDGTLRGNDTSYGTGTVNYSTGSVVVTLGALPDAGSTVIALWGTKSVDTVQPPATLRVTHEQMLTLPDRTGINPLSLQISWPGAGGTTKTAHDDGKGAITGDATGTIDYVTGRLRLIPNALPPGGATLSISYSTGDVASETFDSPPLDSSRRITIDAVGTNLIPGSVRLTWPVTADVSSQIGQWGKTEIIAIGGQTTRTTNVTATDDGAGNLIVDGNVVGTINYSTGVATVSTDYATTMPVIRRRTVNAGMVYSGDQLIFSVVNKVINDGAVYIPVTATYSGGTVTLSYVSSSSANTTSTQTPFIAGLDLTPDYAEHIVPGSLRLTIGSHTLIDNNGRLIADVDPSTGSGTQWGSLDYITGAAGLIAWEAGVANSVQRTHLLTTMGTDLTDEVVFRTASAPLRPGAFILQFKRSLSGDLVTLSADLNGVITGTGVSGTIDYQTGIGRIRFGSRVTAAGNESEPWYNPDLVDSNGRIWRPERVLADTIRYAAVAYSYLPLDASIIGIDPVRLPADGRVPIFRAGGFAVVGHTGKLTGITASAGQTINCGRVRLSRVRIIGANGAAINTGWHADLEAGTVTIDDPTGWAQPITIEHRIEDMAVVSDAQISGDITFTRPLTHDYPAGSYISSALVAGDLFARVVRVFDQQTWTGKWQSTPDGNEATATFNHAVFPITVTNRGAVTESWLVQFTNTTSFQVIGQHVGLIATGNTATDCAPINPATGAPYFTIPALGWGGGWSTGNCLRFDTQGAMFPVWIVRTIQQGPETVPNDSFTLLVRGDVDTQ